MELLYLLLSSSHLPTPKENDYFYWQWFIGSSLLLIPISIHIGKKIGMDVAAFLYFAGFSSLSIVGNAFSKFTDMHSQIKLDLVTNSFMSSFYLFLIAAGCIALGNIRKKIISYIPIYTTINAIYVITNYLLKIRYTHSHGPSGFIDYSGMNACLMAGTVGFLMPEKIRSLKTIGLLLTIVAVFLSNSAIGIGVLALAILSYSVIRCRRCLFLVPVICAVAIIILGVDNFTDSGGRVAAYKTYFKSWLQAKDFFLGSGQGTFATLGIHIQRVNGFMPNWRWVWMHSDWLQILFESGVLGLVLSVSVYVRSVLTFWIQKDPKLFSFVIAMGGCAIFNYPLRLFPTAILCALVVTEALENGTIKPSKIICFLKDKIK